MVGPPEIRSEPSKVYSLTLPGWVALSLAFTSACSAGESGGPPRDPDVTPSGGSNHAGNASGTGNGSGTGSSSAAGGSSGAGAGSGSGPGGSTTGGDTHAGSGSPSVASESLPARIRRLTRAEYDSSARALLGTTTFPSTDFSFPPDAKQGPANSPAGPAFTVNDAQRVDPVLATKLDTAAQALVSEARASGKLDELSPCANPSATGADACAEEFIRSFGARAYRRPLGEDETAGLLKAYHVGADGYTHEEGIDLVTRVLLQSPGFLYVTEIGEGGTSRAS